MKLIVVMLDRWRTYGAIAFENSHVPYGRRLVQIELTPEQASRLRPLQLGTNKGEPVTEEIGDVWLEPS